MIDLRQDDAWQSKMLNFFDEKTNFDKLNGEFGELQTKISFKDMRFNFISLTLQVALVLLCFMIKKKMNL
ncbi:hypothetical protein UXU46_00780 (plasmid) [Campylobacter jejuni]